ncbi:MAG: hypothetical protein V4699_01850 [Patescibacteria group bacterium]
MLLNNKTKKIISALLLISIMLPTVLFSTPKKVSAQITVTDAVNAVFNTITSIFTQSGTASTIVQTGSILKSAMIELGKQLLKVAAKQLLAKMTQATINWINSDFHGAPLFLENPESFFRDIAKSQVRSIVDMIGYDTFRFPFGPQTALNVISSYKSQLAENSQYTLSKVINDPDLLIKYRNDFNYGGWNGFLINTQYPQNNYLGFQGIIQQNLASRLEGTLVAPAQKVQNLLQQGMGFLSPQTCPSNLSYNNGTNEFVKPSFKSKIPYNAPEYTATSQREIDNYNADYNADVAVERAAWASTNTCPGGLVSTTPGSVAANQISTALSIPFLTTALDGALGNSLAAIFDALINHFLDKGLNALSDTISPGSGSDDNWTYNGQSLSSGASINNGAPVGALNIPQNVSVDVGQGTSTTISGGTGPYNMIPQTQTSKAIATATVSNAGSSGPKITVIGVASGTTSATVFDSSTPSKTVTITITVNAIGALVAVPPNVSTNINNPFVTSISGGEGNYSIQTGPNEAIALAIISGTNLILTGIAPGTTSATVQDSSTPPKNVTIGVTIIDPSVLILSQQDVFTYTGQTSYTTISGGNKPYLIIVANNSDVATATILGDIITVTGRKQGEASIMFRDSSPSPKTATVAITIANPLIVSPHSLSVNRSGSFNQLRTAVASISGGTAPYSVIQTPESATISSATIVGNTLRVTGLSRGTTSVLVKDSSIAHPQTFPVSITVN